MNKNDTPSKPSHDVRLLLVDDDPSAILAMSRMLTQYAHQRFATSGQEALQLAREATPDLILLDADMPGMTGFDVCLALKSDPALAHVPVIFASSYNIPQLEVAALENGAVDFVTKPLIAAQLTARVRARLRDSQLARETQRDLAGSARATLPRLLIVDDDVAALRILYRTLLTIGEINYVTSSEEALPLARLIGPDLILLDNQMNGLDGFAVCKALKAEQAFRHVPVVFVSSFSDPRTERHAFDLGAADFIAKPYAPAVMKARVRNLLERVHLRSSQRYCTDRSRHTFIDKVSA